MTDSTPPPPGPPSPPPGWSPAAPGPPPPGAYLDSARVPSGLPGGVVLAGFWIRLAGFFVDWLLFFAISFGLSLIWSTRQVTVVGGSTVVFHGSTAAVDLVVLVLEIVYFTWLWSSWGASLGQQLVGVKVIDASTGDRPRLSQALVRFVGYVISALCILLGFIWVAFDGRKEGWMDKLASTLVVRAR